ncbi:MAG: hypothetical protein FGM57_00900 [Candidatus Taylorbacteria bacterium]|nr:hypothetical protein [Candidatus Taylorbacteria bacterium]
MPGICINNTNKNNYLIPKIGVSGAADMGFLSQDAYEIAKEVGREIARQGAIMMSGATTGFPYWAAMGCKEECGVSVGLSPAESVREHTEVYRLPLEYMDFITFTGFGYSGRDLLFTRSCDAIIIGPGRIGTFHEFTISFEDQKPIGILKGDGEWATDDIIKIMVENSHRPNNKIVFDDNPKRLIAKLLDLIAEDRKLLKGYKNYDGVSSAKDSTIL